MCMHTVDNNVNKFNYIVRNLFNPRVQKQYL